MIKSVIQRIINKFGYTINKVDKVPFEATEEEIEDILFVGPYTATSVARRYALIKAVKYVIKNDIPGDFVECGVWRGGSAMLIAQTLKRLGASMRKIWLYDTFEGMPPPTEDDKSGNGVLAKQILANEEKGTGVWCYSSLEEVRTNFKKVDYPMENVYFVVGPVESTIPGNIPNKICLLRLDTDWYESTKHELRHLWPILEKNGIMIIDDYGDWKGARKAVDEFCANNPRILLNVIDETGRVVQKIGE